MNFTRARVRVAVTALVAVSMLFGYTTQAATPAAPAAPPSTDINLTSYANGAWILKKPAEYDESWSTFWLLDERSQPVGPRLKAR